MLYLTTTLVGCLRCLGKTAIDPSDTFSLTTSWNDQKQLQKSSTGKGICPWMRVLLVETLRFTQ